MGRLNDFYCLIFFLNAVYTIAPQFTIKVGPIQKDLVQLNNKSYTSYKNGTLSTYFDIASYSKFSCTPPPITVFKATSYDQTKKKSQIFIIPITLLNNATNTTYSLEGTSVSNYYDYENIKSDREYIDGNNYNYIPPNKSVTFNVIHNCDALITNSNYWSVININLIFKQGNTANYQTVNFQYQMLCDPNYNPQKFDYSYFILLIGFSMVLLITARYGKIRSFKYFVKSTYQTFSEKKEDQLQIFQGFALNYKYSIVYILVISIGLLLQFQLTKTDRNANNTVSIGLTTFSLTFLEFNEILCLFECQFLRKSFIKVIRYCDTLSFLLTIILISLYVQFNQAWFLSNLIFVFLLSSALKLLKITSLKNAIQFFVPCLIMDSIATLFLTIYVKHNWDIIMLLENNNPLLAEIPYFQFIYQKKCAWLSIYSLLLPGLFFGYVSRYDTNKNTFVYTIVSFFGLILGLLAWLSSTFMTGMTPLPMTFFTLTPQVGLSALMALRRGDLQTFWSGFFYDEVLLNPFKNDGPDLFTSRVSIELEKSNGQGEVELPKSELSTSRESGTFVVNQKLFAGIAVAEQL